MAQPALSRQIQDLEEEVGFKLFERLPRAGKLSLAGMLFLEDARRILQEVSEAAARAARGQSGTLRIGFTENASWRGVVPDSFRRFREQHPDAELELQPAASLEQLEAIRSGRLDVGFLNFMPKADLELDQLLVATQRVELAVPKRHPLTKLKKLLSLAKMLSGANAFRIRGTSSNPRTVCNNVTCSAAGQITIRQPQVRFKRAYCRREQEILPPSRFALRMLGDKFLTEARPQCSVFLAIETHPIRRGPAPSLRRER